MARPVRHVSIVEHALLEALGKLADVAPTEITLLSEESDWGLVGGDLRDAMKLAEKETVVAPLVSEREELVEA